MSPDNLSDYTGSAWMVQKAFWAVFYLILALIPFCAAGIGLLHARINKIGAYMDRAKGSGENPIFYMVVMGLIIIGLTFTFYSVFILNGGKNVPDLKEIKIFYQWSSCKIRQDNTCSDEIQTKLDHRQQEKIYDKYQKKFELQPRKHSKKP